MSTVLITGATGFIGSHLTRRLVEDGHEVHLLCRPESDFRRVEDLLPRLRTHPAGLENLRGLTGLVRTIEPELVFHLADLNMVAGREPALGDIVVVNVAGTAHLLEACEAVRYRGLVTTGDSFEYTPSAEPLRESAPCRPDSLHGLTKLAATLLAREVARARGRPIVTLRLFSTYGPGDNPRRLVPRVIRGALEGTPLLLSRPEIARDWVYVDDVVELFLEAAFRAADLSGAVFNAGSGRAHDLRQVVETILRLTGSDAEVRWGAFPAPSHDAYPWIADTSRTFDAFAWRPRVSLEEGLRATIAAAGSPVLP